MVLSTIRLSVIESMTLHSSTSQAAAIMSLQSCAAQICLARPERANKSRNGTARLVNCFTLLDTAGYTPGHPKKP